MKLTAARSNGVPAASSVGTRADAPAGHGMPVAGLLLCLTSAVSFGLAAVFAKESYRAGLSVTSMLTGRFAIAALVFWVIVLRRRPAKPAGRVIGIGIVLGAIGYAGQSACYFGALTKLNAGMVAQLLYIYPALVVVIALARRRLSAGPRILIALGCSAVGLLLLLKVGGGGASMPAVGIGMALGAAVIYALYITVAGTLPPTVDVYLLSAVVCSSAAISLGGYGLLAGSLALPTNIAGWFWMSMMALVPSVIAIVTFLAGMRLVGGSSAAILSCVEPVVTATSAMLVYHEHIGIVQALGGVVVLASVVVLSARRRTRASPVVPAGVPADSSAELAQQRGDLLAESL